MTKKEYAKTLTGYPTALTVKETAELLRITTKTIYKLIKEKAIPTVKVGREYRILKKNVVDYLRQRELNGSNLKCVYSDKSLKNTWTYETTCDIVAIGNKKVPIYLMKGVKKNGNKKHISSKRTG